MASSSSLSSLSTPSNPSSQNSPPPSPPPGQWPTKYGYPADKAPNLPRDQSCYTPIRPSFPPLPNAPGFPVNQPRIDAIETFQRSKLNGFTTQDLVDLDVITDAKLKPSTLRTDRRIHRLFQGIRWETRPSRDHQRRNVYDLPKRDNLSGTWTYSNPLVQKAIQPALRIATQIMESVYSIWPLRFRHVISLSLESSSSDFQDSANPVFPVVLPWFVALMDYPGMTNIAASRVHPDDIRTDRKITKQLKTFSAVGAMTPQMLQSVQAQFNELVVQLAVKHKYQLGFSKLFEDPWTGQPVSMEYLGLTCEDKFDRIFTFLTYDHVEPLLRPDLSDCERMGLDCSLANLLIHETCHAIYKAICLKYATSSTHEPYFENEPVAELGFAMEKNVFGGLAERMIGDLHDLTIGYWLMLENTSIDIAYRSTDPLLIKPLFPLTQTLFPVKAEYFENIQQEDFWLACIAVYGWPALHARNLQEGVKIKYKRGGPRNRLDEYISRESVNRIKVADLRINEFRLSLATYTRQAAGTLTDVERGNIRISNSIIHHSVYEEIFWSRSVETRDFLNSVVDSLEYVSRGKSLEERRITLNEIVIFLQGAGTKHLLAVQAFNNLDPALQRDDRWEDLLRWNTGARQYAKGIYDLIKGDTAFLSTEDVLRHRVEFEFCRMLLFAPDDMPGIPGYSEEKHIMSIDQNLRLNELELLEGNLEVLDSEVDGSLYIEAVVLQFRSEERYKEFESQGLLMDQQAVNETFNQTARALATFTELRLSCDSAPGAGSEKIPRWANKLETWITRADAYLDLCRERQLQIDSQDVGQQGNQALA
ncbi:hypothetical protein VTL71DRAFT_13636 [Oculimacula yallundae]|uniref:Uncharacterized protein n=1 Tax=Oculimacula yallundae TaxID=86028 RepID=A0ABR4CKX9_9HELO